MNDIVQAFYNKDSVTVHVSCTVCLRPGHAINKMIHITEDCEYLPFYFVSPYKYSPTHKTRKSQHSISHTAK